MSSAGRVPGRGAAVARQLGLLAAPGADGSGSGSGNGNGNGNGEAALEAELLRLLRGRDGAESGQRPPRTDVGAVQALAQLCLRDPPEEEEEEEGEEDLENEQELLAELQEVLQEGPESAESAESAESPQDPAGALLAELSERAELYRAALANAGNGAGSTGSNGARQRRLQRGLKTLEQLLASVRSGKPIDRAEIPPPVALGRPGGTPVQPPAPIPPSDPSPEHKPDPDPKFDPKFDAKFDAKAEAGSGARRRLQELRREAVLAKRRGDAAAALSRFREAKRLQAQLEALGRGAEPDPEESKDPPEEDPPEEDPAISSPAPAGDARQALQQRMERYRAALGQARASGDARKARMHQRILKQYEAALGALSAGRAVDLSELPVPPGCPPIPGSGPPSEPGVAGVVQAALRLTEHSEGEEEEQEEQEEEEEPKVGFGGRREVQPEAPPAPPPKQQQQPRNGQGAPKPAGKAQLQVQFLELRHKQLVQGALRAKRCQDLVGAREFLRRARGVQAMLGAARAGLPVDLTQVPEVPLDGAEFELGPARGVPTPPEVTKTFLGLAAALRRQHQLCLSFSRQFAQLGNVAETTRCEALALECRSHMETLRREHGRGGPPPRARWEQRTFHVLRSFPELSSSDLELGIERGRGIPAPPGVSPGDLDTFVRFEFPHPSQDEAQRDKTAVVKGTDCPEFRARFRLRLLRGHRGLRRLLSRGIRLEVAQKGGLFRAERALGSAQLRLEALEGSCELRQRLELLDGRRRTGALLEVWVRIREPLGPHRELEPRSERWLRLEPGPERALCPVPEPAPAAAKDGKERPPPALPSLAVLQFDRERLEREMAPAAPPELRRRHQELLGRIRGLRARLQGGDPRFRTEYAEHLERHLGLYAEAARRLGLQGDREAAKEALYKRNLVESELQKLRG
ncbi:coiled-coil and C2 domain-containing protein 1A [Ammospiza caudacuta]|uniref:coiled-coil and C2 domain-containing protein 1A n=1 Tax=Ammospiza caudacuta TaxID=2857398 RepID=UPI0027385E7F|nr:coiled-coil and C2 domain-containing protein 1A [Ammospiza caudacuta]